MKLFGCDLSHWNWISSFEQVADAVDFVILKAGGSDKAFYTDSTFKNRYAAFRSLYVPVGAYYFVGEKFTSEIDGMTDAMRFIDIIGDRQLQFPAILDLEATRMIDKDRVTEASIAFLSTLEQYGFYAMIYASDISGFKDRLNLDHLMKFDKWVARYGTEPKYVTSYGMHQFTSSGNLTGVQRSVDLDYAFKNYPEIMKQHHLNNY